MAYSQFTLRDIEAKLGITLTDVPDMFASVPDGQLGSAVASLLDTYLPLAIGINTEKAKSELLIAPILADVREQLHREVSLFSGVDFDVDPEKGLNGSCDFVFTRSRQQQFIEAPVIIIAEGKNDLPKLGFGQCIAGMVAAKVFNERAGDVDHSPLWLCFHRAGVAVLATDRNRGGNRREGVSPARAHREDCRHPTARARQPRHTLRTGSVTMTEDEAFILNRVRNEVLPCSMTYRTY